MNIVVTINGKRRFVRDRTTVFEACRDTGVYIPHFCFHPKLSVPANCRMCLVDIEKMPKPVPSCATRVTDGMVIRTNSPKAIAAQKGVMEFLLINHPLDCPICDQGGECQLQDLAVGYGASATRFGESKRVVIEKNLGPLISTSMTRCIHCTRCVRFGQEVAGDMELGMTGRGEHAEIMPFIQNTVDSEVSGNMIDICPVGALNSKPFQFSARTWEMKRSPGVAPHDSWGSYVTLQSIGSSIKRVLPRDHEEINECWLSDRDRFSYTGLGSRQRLLSPFVRDKGSLKPRQTEWQEALDAAVAKIEATVKEHGPEQVGVLLGPTSVSEEALLAGEFIRALGSSNIDNRLQQRDMSMDGSQGGIPWFGSSIDDLSLLNSILLVGADPARELPLLPLRLRRLQREKKLKIFSIGAQDIGRQLSLERQRLLPPSQWPQELARLLLAADPSSSLPAGLQSEADADAAADWEVLRQGSTAVLLGAEARRHPAYSSLKFMTQRLAKLCADGYDGVLPESCNTLGASLAGGIPHHGFMRDKMERGGKNARQMLAAPLKLYILINCEPADVLEAQQAHEIFQDAAVIHIGGYMDVARGYADVMLPAALFGERKGAVINLEGNAVTTEEVVPPPGEARPVWKILRMLGSMLRFENFGYRDLDELRTRLISAGDFGGLLVNSLEEEFVPTLAPAAEAADGEGTAFERIYNVAHFGTDQLLRRAEPLQQTRIAKLDRQAALHSADLAELGLKDGGAAVLRVPGAAVDCVVRADDRVARGCLRAPWGVEEFAALGAAGTVRVAAAAAAAEPQQAAAAAA
ncbi:MAG: NADH-quinone oxidoreductase subunit G [Betaproteobacteria bacterium AqS2]|uniref:NADH-quinone oxidoreductase n=1 Tax=Candidatus Amphirhobacter heronislandensis TaxID=1732024 RepID=A0A930XWX9_9GAMM|nr:NADH-quinone oxidoreductase subunit G [Betaproteobacteria bacterium AqS2]